MLNLIKSCSIAAILAIAGTAQAVNISVYDPENSGINSLTFSQTGTTLNIATTWSSDAAAFLLISGLKFDTNYILRHSITNVSGISWDRIANELLDPAGQPNDSDDMGNNLEFIPNGFSTSNDSDGLSFAQKEDIPRTSSIFTAIKVEELTDKRDFLDFYEGILASGETDNVMTFGLLDDNYSANQPFLLSIRPNVFSVPEPSTYALMALGLVSLVAVSRRRMNTATDGRS